MEDFSVPEEYKSDWVLLKADIDSGADLSKYMSKDVTFLE